MKIVLIFRSRKLGYHSIENVFSSLHKELAAKGAVETVYVDEMGFSISNLFTLKKFVKAQPPDTIYHVTGDIHYVVYALPRKRTILTVHDCGYVNGIRGLKGWIVKKIFLYWPVRYVAAVTAISQKSKEEVVAITGCRASKVRVIGNPVASYIEYTQKPFNNDNPTLLFIGTQPNKNLSRVIEAIKGFGCTLNIVGRADKQLISRMEESNIKFVVEKNLSDAQMAKRYEQADIILFPSLYEGFGLPVIEGFKAGRAVLTSDISPMKEIADGAAWLVDPYSVESIRNTLERIVSDQEARDRKIQNGLYIVQNYLPKNIAALYYQAYAELDDQKSVALAS